MADELENEICANVEAELCELESQLQMERKNLRTYLGTVEQARIRWDEEERLAQIGVREAGKALARAEKKLEKLRPAYQTQLQSLIEMEAENNKLNKEFKEMKNEQEKRINDVRLERELLETDLFTTEVCLKDEKEANKWTKFYNRKTIKHLYEDCERKTEEETTRVRNEQFQDIMDTRANIIHLKKTALRDEQSEVKKLNDELERIIFKIGYLETKNQELQDRIAEWQAVDAPVASK